MALKSLTILARLVLLGCPLIWASSARADIPAFYTGTPYLGTARDIPGRIDFADVDLGGSGVAWDTDHNRGTDAPQSGDDYRPEDQDLPNINKTNRFLVDQTWSEDFWEDGTTRYPSEAEPHDYYLGASHAGDWVRLTVNVQQAGLYNVSSNWACESGPMCGCSIWFNDGSDPAGPEDGVNKSGLVMLDSTGSYHLWRSYPNFAQVELSAGLQVMTFYVEVADHLQYSFLQFDLVGGGGSGGAGGIGGTGGAAGALPGGTGGDPGAGGVSNGGTGGSQAGSTAIPAGGGTTAGGGAGGSTMPVGSSPSSSDANTDSSCAAAGHRPSSRAPWLLLVALGAAGLSRRRRCAWRLPS